MATRRKVPELITTREEAHLAAVHLAGAADGVRRVTDFLGQLNAGRATTIGSAVDEGTEEWLNAILFPWVEERADEIQRHAEALQSFLEAARPVAVA